MGRQAGGEFEVHEHCITSGPRANRGVRIVHSHPGGNEPHQHAETGPASYTIDKDEWFAATGLRGGGRKKFTKRPTGEQLPIVELEGWQRSFKVVVCDPPAEYIGEGPGIALPARMVLGFGMHVAAVEDRTTPPSKAA